MGLPAGSIKTAVLAVTTFTYAANRAFNLALQVLSLVPSPNLQTARLRDSLNANTCSG